MIESIMYFGLGFCLAGLSVLIVMPIVHGRAVRLTTRQLETSIPSSLLDVLAEKDLQRADFAMSTRRLERNVEQFRTKSAGQLAELGRKSDAVNRLKIEVGTLRDQLRANEENVAVKGNVRDAERTLSEKESELAKLRCAFDERSVLADSQKAEIVALTGQIQTLKEQLTQANEQARAAEDYRDAAMREAERALSEKESELAKLRCAFDERSVLADSQKAEIVALTGQIQTLKEQLTQANEQARAAEDYRDAAVREAERALSEKESELATLTRTFNERSVLAGSQKAEIAALTGHVQTLKEQLTQAKEEARAAEDRGEAAVREAERALSEKESELAKLTSAFNERSVLADSLKAEIVALTGQVQTLKEQLTQAGAEAKAAEDRRAATRIELEATIQKLTGERVQFEHFHGRVSELVRQVVARTTEDKILARRAQEDLESRLIEQSQLLKERELELNNLRGEIEIARQAEYDVRTAMIEIDGRANAATQNFKAENARLQASLERANGERVRLAYELANIKRLSKETRAA